MPKQTLNRVVAENETFAARLSARLKAQVPPMSVGELASRLAPEVQEMNEVPGRIPVKTPKLKGQPGHVKKYVTGEAEPRLSTLRRIGTETRTSLDYLAFGDPFPIDPAARVASTTDLASALYAHILVKHVSAVPRMDAVDVSIFLAAFPTHTDLLAVFNRDRIIAAYNARRVAAWALLRKSVAKAPFGGYDDERERKQRLLRLIDSEIGDPEHILRPKPFAFQGTAVETRSDWIAAPAVFGAVAWLEDLGLLHVVPTSFPVHPANAPTGIADASYRVDCLREPFRGSSPTRAVHKANHWMALAASSVIKSDSEEE